MRGADPSRRVRLVVPGRELIDTLDAVRRHDFSARDLPGHGLKVVARHFGLAKEDRERIRGDQIHTVYRHDPERVRRYATSDVEEVAGGQVHQLEPVSDPVGLGALARPRRTQQHHPHALAHPSNLHRCAAISSSMLSRSRRPAARKAFRPHRSR